MRLLPGVAAVCAAAAATAPVAATADHSGASARSFGKLFHGIDGKSWCSL